MAAQGRMVRLRVWNSKGYSAINEMRNLEDWDSVTEFQLAMEHAVFHAVSTHISSNPPGRRREFEMARGTGLPTEKGWYVQTNTPWAGQTVNEVEPEHNRVRAHLRTAIRWSNQPAAAEPFSDDALANIAFRTQDWPLIRDTAHLIICNRHHDRLQLQGEHANSIVTPELREAAFSAFVRPGNEVDIATWRAARRTAQVASRASAEAVAHGQNLPPGFDIDQATNQGIIYATQENQNVFGGGDDAEEEDGSSGEEN